MQGFAPAPAKIVVKCVVDKLYKLAPFSFQAECRGFEPLRPLFSSHMTANALRCHPATQGVLVSPTSRVSNRPYHRMTFPVVANIRQRAPPTAYRPCRDSHQFPIFTCKDSCRHGEYLRRHDHDAAHTDSGDGHGHSCVAADGNRAALGLDMPVNRAAQTFK